ncbi:LysE family translocator [Jiella sp. M17.18]|uniref:LysE family translocator n=1 Tax=Jiella sp. M17.18 TaxID=3234247 RepID=UPI0034DEAAFC
MPVEPATLAAFVLASTILLVIPGPTVVMVVGQALAHGRRVALASVAGVGLGDLCAASLSLAGVGALLAASAEAFAVLKWAGAAYLVFMGIKLWRHPPAFAQTPGDAPAGSPRKVFQDAFLVTLFNPKGIVFFAAFVPQFVSPAQAYLPQAAIFVGVFVALGIANAALYARLAATARSLARRPVVLRRMGRTGAVCLISAGIASALVQRPA